MTIADIKYQTIEGRLFLASMAILTTELYTKATPDEVLQRVQDLSNKMYVEPIQEPRFKMPNFNNDVTGIIKDMVKKFIDETDLPQAQKEIFKRAVGDNWADEKMDVSKLVEQIAPRLLSRVHGQIEQIVSVELDVFTGVLKNASMHSTEPEVIAEKALKNLQKNFAPNAIIG